VIGPINVGGGNLGEGVGEKGALKSVDRFERVSFVAQASRLHSRDQSKPELQARRPFHNGASCGRVGARAGEIGNRIV